MLDVKGKRDGVNTVLREELHKDKTLTGDYVNY